MIQREVICSFFGLYPWNSSSIDLELDQEVIDSVAEKVATDTIFTEVGQRFYDYCRGRNDEREGIQENTVMKKMENLTDDEVSDWVRSNFAPKDLLQFYFTIRLPDWLAELYYMELTEFKDGTKEYNSETVKDILEVLENKENSPEVEKIINLLEDNPDFPELLEWAKTKEKEVCQKN